MGHIAVCGSNSRAPLRGTNTVLKQHMYQQSESSFIDVRDEWDQGAAITILQLASDFSTLKQTKQVPIQKLFAPLEETTIS